MNKLGIKTLGSMLCLALLLVLTGGILSATANPLAEEAAPVSYEAELPAFIQIAPETRTLSGMTAMLHVSNASNGRFIMGSGIFGQLDTTHIAATFRLERLNADGTVRSQLGSWSSSVNDNWLAWERPHYVARNNYYRFTVTAAITRNGRVTHYSVSQTTFMP